MNEQKAREILNGCITKKGTLCNYTDKSKPYMNSGYGYGSTIFIDGTVSIRELKAIVWWM